MAENYERIKELALRDVEILKHKGKSYGSSWKKRGGVGAFMMLARKWDRIENICEKLKYDILSAGQLNSGDILDDIQDLRQYLLLVESEIYSLPPVSPQAPSVPSQVIFTPPPLTTGEPK